MILPTDDKERSKYRLCDYYRKYFLKAQLAKAKHSYESNIKHCGEEGMEWASAKSVGDGNQVMRHLMEGLEAADSDDIRNAEYHLTCLAWRADELLERLLNKMPPFEHLQSVGMYQVEEEKMIFPEWIAECAWVYSHDDLLWENDSYGDRKFTAKEVFDKYEEYVNDSKVAVGEPKTDEDTEVVCGAESQEKFEKWAGRNGFTWSAYWCMFIDKGEGKRHRYEEVFKLYSQYLAECKDAKDGAEAH